MTKKNKIINLIKFGLIIGLALTLVACSKSSKTGETSENRVNIVVTTFPCYDFVRAATVDLDNINIKMLIKPGAEIHSYDPTPQDLIAIQKSDLFVYNGGESDKWVFELLESMDNRPKSVKLVDSVILLEEDHFLEDEHSHEAEGHHHGHSQEEIEADEHVWTSPENARKMLEFVV